MTDDLPEYATRMGALIMAYYPDEETRLRVAQQVLNRWREAQQGIVAVRDDTLMRLVDQGWRYKRLSAATGLSVPRIDQIVAKNTRIDHRHGTVR